MRKLSSLENQCQPGWSRDRHWFSRGDNFPHYPLMQSIIIILFWMLIKYISYTTLCFGFKTIQVRLIIELICISYSVNSNSHTTPVRIYGEPYSHKFCAVDIFFKNHPSSSNITRCQVPSREKACMVSWFSGWFWFLSNVSQPIRINYFNYMKYNILK